ncbi:unnamed protein product [Tetraodon nigroviridis]|nr:unnamed protein product [Tetraodon nigroviridis]
MIQISTDRSSGATYFSNERVNGEDVRISFGEAPEVDGLLRPTSGVRERAALERGSSEQTSRPQEEHLMCRIQRELKQAVFPNIFPKVQLWMIIGLLLFIIVIIAVILISLAVCAALHEDEDEKFDPSLFKVPLYHNGTFRLPNQDFTKDLINMSSTQSQVLAASLQEKIAGFYTSSPALGRYFSEASISAFRDGENDQSPSVIAHYRLKFLMPEEEEDQLRNFTLSREMVFNVFRQLLYDQEADAAEELYIAHDSLRTF